MTDKHETTAQHMMAAQTAHIAGRRARLPTAPNPATHIDYLVALAGQAGGGTLTVNLCYVPDKWLVTPESFTHYLDGLDDRETASGEALAALILDDLNNELVPRWAQIIVRDTRILPPGTHGILVEDRQPHWDNVALLSRVGGL